MLKRGGRKPTGGRCTSSEMTNSLFFGNFFYQGGSQTESLLLKCRAFQDNNPVVTQLELSEQQMLHPIQGRRQAVRQQVLILPCVGSNPAAPAIFQDSNVFNPVPGKMSTGFSRFCDFARLRASWARVVPYRVTRKSPAFRSAPWPVHQPAPAFGSPGCPAVPAPATPHNR